MCNAEIPYNPSDQTAYTRDTYDDIAVVLRVEHAAAVVRAVPLVDATIHHQRPALGHEHHSPVKGDVVSKDAACHA